MPPRRFLPAAKTEFTERTIHNSVHLKVVDHLIVSAQNTFSFLKAGLL
jgi:DNA repair protein RadC